MSVLSGARLRLVGGSFSKIISAEKKLHLYLTTVAFDIALANAINFDCSVIKYFQRALAACSHVLSVLVWKYDLAMFAVVY